MYITFEDDKSVVDTPTEEKRDSKFTPGPWEYRNGYVIHRNATDRIGRAKSYAICGVSLPGANEMRAATGGYGTYEQAQAIRDANGRLLAAAPTLCEALRKALSILDKTDIPTYGAVLIEGRAALALVDGPQNQEAQ